MKSSDAPSDAVRTLNAVLAIDGVFTVRAFIATGIANLRRAFPGDDAFARALDVTAREIVNAFRGKDRAGTALEHGLLGFRRVRFASKRGTEADLRLVFRVHAKGIDVIAFGHRDNPESIYRTARRRT